MTSKYPLRPTSFAFVTFVVTNSIIAATGVTNARASCDGKEVLFTDDFSKPVLSELSWGPHGASAFRNGKFVVTLEPNGSFRSWPSDHLFSENYSVCVQVKLPSDPKGAAGSGIAFWINPAKNRNGDNDYYMAAISPDGYYWVSKFVNGTQTPVVDEFQQPTVKAGPDDLNELSVTLRGNLGTFSVNGTEVGKFSGQPTIRSNAGITAGAPLDKKYVIEFYNFRVLRP